MRFVPFAFAFLLLAGWPTSSPADEQPGKVQPKAGRIAPALGLRAGSMSLHCIADHPWEPSMTRLLSRWSRYFLPLQRDCGTSNQLAKGRRHGKRKPLTVEWLEERTVPSVVVDDFNAP